MDSCLREDVLEAILSLVSETPPSSTAKEIAAALGIDPGEIRQVFADLITEGLCTGSADGRIRLTGPGREVAARIARKHHVLECFFTEMLGMDPDSAAREACTLEHEISEDAIDRLSTYLGRPARGRGGWGRRMASLQVPPDSLLHFVEGSTVRVVGMVGPGNHGRLLDLGIVPGETLTVRRKLRNRTVVVKVKGCDVAISPEIAATIQVEPVA